MPPQPDPPKQSKTPALIAAAVLIAAPLTAAYEGLRTHPYHDPGDGRLTVCYGETERAMRTYTRDECAVLLSARLQRDYAPGVLKCVPAIDTRRDAFAASIDAAYNSGIGGFCRSRMALAFNAGQWRHGCDGFLGWRATANGHVLRGLERRREAERALCLKGAA